MRERVLITEPEYMKAKSLFDAAEGFDVRCVQPDESTLAAEVQTTGCRAIIVGVKKYTGPLYDALGDAGGNRGAILARFGVGHDGVDKIKAAARNIVVTNTPGVLDASVAEHAVWLMGACARNIAFLHDEMRESVFAPRSGMELAGKTLVVLGFGPIGRRVAKIASHGLGMRVIAVDLLSKTQLAANLGLLFSEIASEHGLVDYLTDADEAIRKGDVISVHLPATTATRHFINSDRLAASKPGAIFLNTARGSLVDESALFDALRTRQLAAAGLDVFENEPYAPVAPDKDLRMLPNVVLTPHVGSNTSESNSRMAACCLNNIRRFISGRMDQLDTVS